MAKFFINEKDKLCVSESGGGSTVIADIVKKDEVERLLEDAKLGSIKGFKVSMRGLLIAEFRYKHDLEMFIQAYIAQHSGTFLQLTIEGSNGHTPQ